ncbi:MAG: hypothetical protein AAF599_18490, partial [Bacteroidota bacterium]
TQYLSFFLANYNYLQGVQAARRLTRNVSPSAKTTLYARHFLILTLKNSHTKQKQLEKNILLDSHHTFLHLLWTYLRVLSCPTTYRAKDWIPGA